MRPRFRDPLLTILSAVLLVIPFHSGEWGFLANVAFIPYFFAVRNKSAAAAFKLGCLFGTVFYFLLGFWMCYVSVLGFLLLTAYLALYFGAFGFFSADFMNVETPAFIPLKAKIRSLFLVPAVWVALEYVRGWVFGGLPWALLGYSQWKNIAWIQIADIFGAHGVSFFVMLVNLILFRLILAGSPRKREGQEEAYHKKYLVTLACVLAGTFLFVGGYGAAVLAVRDRALRNPGAYSSLRVSVIQGNIPQEEKWNARIKNIIFEKYRRLTLMSAALGPDLIVWPETSFPGYLEDEPILAAALRHLVRQTKTPVLVGAPTLGNLEYGLRFFNSAVLYGPSGEEVKRYSKLHLVPFGEYVPFEPALRVVRHFFNIGRFNPGTEKTIFIVRPRNPKALPARFGVLICFEDIFPFLVRDFCRNGADFLVNITNDAWFGRTTAPYQHAQASVFRAVENRVPVVRAANTGLSCFISAEGRILDSVKDADGNEIFVTGHKAREIVIRKTSSLYTRFGDPTLLLVLGLCVWAFRERARQQDSY